MTTSEEHRIDGQWYAILYTPLGVAEGGFRVDLPRFDISFQAPTRAAGRKEAKLRLEAAVAEERLPVEPDLARIVARASFGTATLPTWRGFS